MGEQRSMHMAEAEQRSTVRQGKLDLSEQTRTAHFPEHSAPTGPPPAARPPPRPAQRGTPRRRAEGRHSPQPWPSRDGARAQSVRVVPGSAQRAPAVAKPAALQSHAPEIAAPSRPDSERAAGALAETPQRAQCWRPRRPPLCRHRSKFPIRSSATVCVTMGPAASPARAPPSRWVARPFGRQLERL